MSERRKRVCIGIPCFQGVSAETLEDYMRFAYHLGRRNQEFDFFLAIKSKSEQFRARNSIVEAAAQMGCDYLLQLDDDHVIAWESSSGYARDGKIIGDQKYNFLARLIGHMEADPKLGLVGALYYHRGADCLPVLMKEGKDGGYYYLRDDQVKHELQEVAVQGGGCMLIRMDLFGRVPMPWFDSEAATGMGTDLQICTKIREHGYKVACDTSITLGHVMSRREVVTPKNRHRILSEQAHRGTGDEPLFDPRYTTSAAIGLYQQDAAERLGMPLENMVTLAAQYSKENLPKFKEFANPKDYYANLGPEQLARQVWFHSLPSVVEQAEMWWNLINSNEDGYGLDFGCGSAPVGFELVMRGQRIDFVDIDGSPAYEFTKWRAKKRGVENRCGWKLGGPYDYVLMLDSIEHLENWREVLGDIIDRLKPNSGALLTNFFVNRDFQNPEHINMDHEAVQRFLVGKGVYPLNQLVWMKRDLGFMDCREKEEAA